MPAKPNTGHMRGAASAALGRLRDDDATSRSDAMEILRHALNLSTDFEDTHGIDLDEDEETDDPDTDEDGDTTTDDEE